MHEIMSTFDTVFIKGDFKMKMLLFIWLFLSAGINIYSQVKFQTIAEKSDFKSTSDYSDVSSFIENLKKSSPYLRVEYIGQSTEGRDIPLLIIGNPLPDSPEVLLNDKRIVIYIQADIHAGEVEGKEASLMFARELLSEKNPDLLKNVVLLICPLFNPDGNEKISKLNRTHQNGPANGVGVRYNGQFLDLNRDAMKAESPEVKGVIGKVFNRWDPSVFMDCHTTNGSYHIEPVTFTWMVNPDGDNSLITYMRDRMMPEMSETLIGKYKVENCFYGEFFDMMHPEKGWVLDASEPHYMSNYVGIRNRLGILNENYVYSDFRSRVFGCYYLIRSLTDYVSLHRSEIKELVQNADQKTIERGMNPSVADSFGIEFKVKPAPRLVTVQTFEADSVTDSNGRGGYKKSDRQKNVTIPYYIDYYASKSVKFPFAYLITVIDQHVTDLLKLHGIKLEKLKENSAISVDQFIISEIKGSPRLIQGHYTNTVKGSFKREVVSFPAGTIVVRTAQKLADVAAYLLEPQSNDGLLTWNFFDRYLVPQWGMGYYPFPVCKVMENIRLETIPVL
jgi:murein tripeptide amidase MpaA